MKVEVLDYLTSKDAEGIFRKDFVVPSNFRIAKKGDKYVIVYDMVSNGKIYYVQSIGRTECGFILPAHASADSLLEENKIIELGDEYNEKIKENDKKIKIVLDTLNELSKIYSVKGDCITPHHMDPDRKEYDEKMLLLRTFDNLSTVYWEKYDIFEILQRLDKLEIDNARIKGKEELRKEIRRYENEMYRDIYRGMCGIRF